MPAWISLDNNKRKHAYKISTSKTETTHCTVIRKVEHTLMKFRIEQFGAKILL